MTSTQIFSNAFCSFRDAFHFCYYLVSSLISHVLCPWPLVPGASKSHCHAQLYTEGEDGYDIDKYLASLVDAKFSGLGNRARIACWDLSPPISLLPYEGIVTKAPLRGVVDRESIRQGKECSGIFVIESYFELPNGQTFIMKGTAFAVSPFHALTSAHLVWHRKLGPAKWVVLVPDERQRRYIDRVKTCVAIACHANLITSPDEQARKADNDIAMLALAEPFDSGLRFLKCHQKPGPSFDEDGLVIGFPKDMPDYSAGKRLIWSRGWVSCERRNGVMSIEHKVNTVEGNSGSPVIVNDRVVGVHSMHLVDKRRNAAAPINRNGNNVDGFRGILRYIRGQHPKLPEGIQSLGKAKGDTHPGRELRLFT
ncbi:hypothetical protein NPX13_g1012 [Xylaria arbuscula]|uniref:Serine protease n=1 Tax=Xylaria arbuscula TaxID=114810 RepID=A0A9W8NN83_9PEZI|nr:hypothetical protein NPX13_g1012 [Xylaria arbuscula]